MTARRFSPVRGRAGAWLFVIFLTSSVDADEPRSNATSEAARKAGRAARTAADYADRVADSRVAEAQSVHAPDDSPMERARKGVAVLERAGKPLAMGVVLAGDGRILTSLSAVGHGNNLDARFADGSLMRVRVGHTDRAWDLALLVPQNGRWRHGIKPSTLPATKAGTGARTFVSVGGQKVAPSRVIVKGVTTLLGGDSVLLRDGLDLGSRMSERELGTPILDDQGHMMGMVAEACSPDGDQQCRPVAYGVPVSAIKAFLRTVPRDAVPPAPWLGIQGVGADVGPVRGVRVLDVHSESPAAAAGLRGGEGESADVVVAVDGVPVMTPKALAEAINTRAVGESIQLLVFGQGHFRQVTLTLRATPEPSAGRSEQSGGPSHSGR